MTDQRQDSFHKFMPETARIFQELMDATFKEGALTFQMKELIAIGVAVSMGCDDCINHHVETALQNGIAKEEIAEAMAVGFEMGVGRLYPPLRRAITGHFWE